jgi:perosamine synthetase
MSVRIPLSKPSIGDAEKAAVLEVLNSGQLAQGPRTAAFEARFASLIGVPHAVATSSGTTALHLALLAHGIGPGDEVITTALTFVATGNCILHVGATPVFVDVEEATFNISPAAIDKAITRKTKAILPVHLYGLACDMAAIMAIARRHNLLVIEDCAQSIGARSGGKMTGAFGTGAFSLYATKNVTSGEGGMITTHDADIAARCRSLRQHGFASPQVSAELGYNFRTTDLCSAIGLVQLGRLPEFTERRRANAAYLNARLKHVQTPACFATCSAECAKSCEHVWHQYTVRLVGATADERNRAASKLNALGIGAGVFYPIPVHLQQHMKPFAQGEGSLPITERLANEVISLPVHPQLSVAELDEIVTAVHSLFT